MGSGLRAVQPPRPATQSDDVLRSLEALNGLSVTHSTEEYVYQSDWISQGFSSEVKRGQYVYKEENSQSHELVSITSYANFGKSGFLQSLGDITTGLGGAVEIVGFLFPTLRIPSTVSSGLTLTGFISWLEQNLAGDTQKVKLGVRYEERFTEQWRTEFFHKKCE